MIICTILTYFITYLHAIVKSLKCDLHFGVVYALNLTLRLSILKVNNAEMVETPTFFNNFLKVQIEGKKKSNEKRGCKQFLAWRANEKVEHW